MLNRWLWWIGNSSVCLHVLVRSAALVIWMTWTNTATFLGLNLFKMSVAPAGNTRCISDFPQPAGIRNMLHTLRVSLVLEEVLALPPTEQASSDRARRHWEYDLLTTTKRMSFTHYFSASKLTQRHLSHWKLASWCRKAESPFVSSANELINFPRPSCLQV